MSLLNRRILMMNNMEDEEDMGSWELIREIEIEEAAQNISITEDHNGNSFRLKEFEIFVVSMPTELSTAGEITACPTSDRQNPTQIGTTAKKEETKRYCYGHWRQTGMGIIHQKSMQSINGTNTFGNLNMITGAQIIASDSGLVYPNICEGIWIGSHYQDVLSPGTIIRIYGIRE